MKKWMSGSPPVSPSGSSLTMNSVALNATSASEAGEHIAFVGGTHTLLLLAFLVR